MTVENNKKIIEAYVAAVNSANSEAIANLLTDDFVFKCMARKPEWLRLNWGKDATVNQAGFMSSKMKSPIQMKILGMIGEDDQVAAEMESYGEMLNGKIYDNAYHFLYRIRDNKICMMKEYSCSCLASEVFAEFMVQD